MTKELYVSSNPHETKVALVEDDQLAEVFYERENEYTLAGSIYKGRVTRVLPGMQSAFVDIGLERDAFLYVSDFLELQGDDDEEFGQVQVGNGNGDEPQHRTQEPRRERREPQREARTEMPAEPEPTAVIEGGYSEDDDQVAEPAETEATTEETEATNEDSGEGTRRWRGRRRRRGGRRGRNGERNERTESQPSAETAEETPERHERERREEPAYGPPAGYQPIILPGESISKYRNLSGQQRVEPAATPVETEEHWNEDAHDRVSEARAAVSPDETLSQTLIDQDQFEQEETTSVAEEPAAGQSQAAIPETQGTATSEEEDEPASASAELRAPRSILELRNEPAEEEQTEDETLEESVSAPAVEEAETIEEAEELERTSADAALDGREAQTDAEEQMTSAAPADRESGTPSEDENDARRLAPTSAPAGRTLEHEVFDEEESLEEMRLTQDDASESDMELEEQTFERGSEDSSGRWVPQVADIEEDEMEEAAEEFEYTNGDSAEAEETEEELAEEAQGEGAVAGAPAERRFDRRRGRRGRRGRMPARGMQNRSHPLISDLLKEGQEILVQIAKEPIGKKGARITSHIALPGRFLVYMPTVNHVGVSRKISSDEERQRLKRIVTSERENGHGGFIVRTAAANVKEEELRADIRFLKHLWNEIKGRSDKSKAPALIYHDLNLVERVLRDQVTSDFATIWVDNEQEYERVLRFANRFQPSLLRRVKLYTKQTPLFEQFGVQDEINKALKAKVWLKSGGYIVINQTEALVAIDINTGKYVGKTTRLEDTIVKTNIDAIKEIVRQIRVRDLGGIIVIDFIDMDERKNRQKVMAALEEALKSDRAPSKVLQFNDFGLVAITRKRVKQSLERTLGSPCPYCEATGFVKSVSTMCNEIYTEVKKMAHLIEGKDMTIRANPEVAKALKESNGKLLMEFEEISGKTVLVKGDPAMHQENFDIH